MDNAPLFSNGDMMVCDNDKICIHTKDISALDLVSVMMAHIVFVLEAF